jgi:hypothetical protein
MMSLAETWGIRDKHTNPCKDIERYPEHKRERFLSAKEIHRLGEVLRRVSTTCDTPSPRAVCWSGKVCR